MWHRLERQVCARSGHHEHRCTGEKSDRRFSIPVKTERDNDVVITGKSNIINTSCNITIETPDSLLTLIFPAFTPSGLK